MLHKQDQLTDEEDGKICFVLLFTFRLVFIHYFAQFLVFFADFCRGFVVDSKFLIDFYIPDYRIT